MVAVGDIELAVGKVVNKLVDNSLVGAYPDAVGDVVVVGKLILSVGFGLIVNSFERGVLAVHIKRVNLAEVAVCSLHKVKAVCLSLREGELMRQDNAL